MAVYAAPPVASTRLNPLSANFRIETRRLSFLVQETRQSGRADMAKRPVVTGTEARSGTKEGVVRYVLLVSLVLVVVLFVVAYEIFS
jgi:hypothetical protein